MNLSDLKARLNAMGIPLPPGLEAAIRNDASSSTSAKADLIMEILHKIQKFTDEPHEMFDIVITAASYMIDTMIESPKKLPGCSDLNKLAITSAPLFLWNSAVSKATQRLTEHVINEVVNTMKNNPAMVQEAIDSKQYSQFIRKYEASKGVDIPVGEKGPKEKYKSPSE